MARVVWRSDGRRAVLQGPATRWRQRKAAVEDTTAPLTQRRPEAAQEPASQTAILVPTPANPQQKMLRYLANSLRQRDGLTEEEAVAKATDLLQRERQSVKRQTVKKKKRKRSVAGSAIPTGSTGYPTATVAFVRLFKSKKKKAGAGSRAAKSKKSRGRKSKRRGSMFVQGGAPGLGKRS